MICSCCGRDINEIGQDNVSYNEYPLCEDCGRGNDTNIDEEIKIMNKGVNGMGETYIFKVDHEIKVTPRPEFVIKNDYEGKPYLRYNLDMPHKSTIMLKEFDYNDFFEEYKRVLENVHTAQECIGSNLAVVFEVKDYKLSVYSI